VWWVATQDPSYPDHEKKRLARLGLSAFLKMVFLDNFVHGDLHPGNIFVTENPRDRLVGWSYGAWLGLRPLAFLTDDLWFTSGLSRG
jgi:predicted unusual protein kinase regulating ubiquinone biosynthesis (AarF/ABC1/UbiB family)